MIRQSGRQMKHCVCVGNDRFHTYPLLLLPCHWLYHSTSSIEATLKSIARNTLMHTVTRPTKTKRNNNTGVFYWIYSTPLQHKENHWSNCCGASKVLWSSSIREWKQIFALRLTPYAHSSVVSVYTVILSYVENNIRHIMHDFAVAMWQSEGCPCISEVILRLCDINLHQNSIEFSEWAQFCGVFHRKHTYIKSIAMAL